MRKRYYYFIFGLAGVVVLFGLAGCLSMRDRKEAPLSFSDLESCLVQDPADFEAKEKDKCVVRIERFLDRLPSHPKADQITIQLGRFFLEKTDYPAAFQLFRRFLDQYPQSQLKIRARMYLGLCHYYMDNPKDSLNILDSLIDEPDAVPLSKELFYYLAENYVKLDNMPAALAWYERCYNLISEESKRERLQNRILEVVGYGWDLEILNQAAELFPEGFFFEAIQLGMAATSIKNGHLHLAEQYLSDVSILHVDDIFTPHIQALIEQSFSGDHHRICTIGCLLPLTGKYGKFGSNVLDALLLGARAFQRQKEKGISIRLLIRDTQGDPEVAVHHVQELAGRKDVVGIVGPLGSAVAMACAREAQQQGLPMITLTQREDVARGGDYIFQNGLTMKQQVETLVEYMMEEMGFTQFSVLHPKDPYGTLARNLFEDKVLEMGGGMTSAVAYEEKETDFQDEIRQLVGEEFWLEMKTREEERKNKDKLKKNKESLEGIQDDDSQYMQWAEEGEDPYEEEELEEEPLEPPFEALFIPDHYSKVALIAPHLAFYDLNNITLLGTNAWNSPHLVEQAGEYLTDAIFVDGFFAQSTIPSVRDFLDNYIRAFNREPRVLEAQGYDSLLIMEESFFRAKLKTRKKVRNALANMEGYPGLSGYTLFNEDGCAKKRLYLLFIEQNDIQEIY